MTDATNARSFGFRRAISLVLASVLVVALVPATAAKAVTATDKNGNSVTQLSSSTPCQDVVFLGVRGSGEKSSTGTWGMGNPVTAVFESFLDSMRESRIAAGGVDYRAAAVPTWKSLTVFGPEAWADYFDSIDGGVFAARSILSDRSLRCPEEKYVLAGYSQGGMVIHRLAFDLSRAPLGSPLDKILPRIAAIATVGDGDRVPFDDVVSLGSSPSEAIDFGVGVAGLPSGAAFVSTDAPVSSLGNGLEKRWFQVCDYGDLVCDYGRALTVGPFITDLIAGITFGYKTHSKNYDKQNFAVVEAGSSAAREATNYDFSQSSYNFAIQVIADPVPAQYSAVGYVAPFNVWVENTGTERMWLGMVNAECSISMMTWGTTGQPPLDQTYISPGETWAWDCWHTVTQADIDRGYYSAIGSVFASADAYDVANSVVIPTETVEELISVPLQMMSAAVSGTSITRYQAEWLLTLSNIGDQVVIPGYFTSTMCGFVELDGEPLSPGESLSVSCSSTVDDAYLDGSMGTILNEVQATAYGLDGQPYAATSSGAVEAPRS